MRASGLPSPTSTVVELPIYMHALTTLSPALSLPFMSNPVRTAAVPDEGKEGKAGSGGEGGGFGLEYD